MKDWESVQGAMERHHYAVLDGNAHVGRFGYLADAADRFARSGEGYVGRGSVETLASWIRRDVGGCRAWLAEGR